MFPNMFRNILYPNIYHLDDFGEINEFFIFFKGFHFVKHKNGGHSL